MQGCLGGLALLGGLECVELILLGVFLAGLKLLGGAILGES